MARVPELLCVPRARVPQFCLSVPRSYIKFFSHFKVYVPELSCSKLCIAFLRRNFFRIPKT